MRDNPSPEYSSIQVFQETQFVTLCTRATPNKHTHTCTHTLMHRHTTSLWNTHKHTCTNTHAQTSLWNTHTHYISLSKHTNTQLSSLSLSLTHTLSLYLSQTHTHTHTHKWSLSHTHKHKHTHKHTHIHTRFDSLGVVTSSSPLHQVVEGRVAVWRPLIKSH